MRKQPYPFTINGHARLSANATQALRRNVARKGYVTAKASNPLIEFIKRLLTDW